jgi:multidrug efflux pump subunit AcrA (membrane-fusion protein)
MKIVHGLFACRSAAMMAGCHGGESASPAAIQTMQARVVESQQQQVPLNVRSTGTVHARETAIVSAQVMGRIQQVLVRAGDSVRAGQTLVVLDDAACALRRIRRRRGEGSARRAGGGADRRRAGGQHAGRYRQLQARRA